MIVVLGSHASSVVSLVEHTLRCRLRHHALTHGAYSRWVFGVAGREYYEVRAEGFCGMIGDN